MKIPLPPKPSFHPNDSFRAMQGKLDAFYADLERLFSQGQRVARQAQASWWPYTEAPPGADEEAFLINVHKIEISDADLVEKLAQLDPQLAAHIRRRLGDVE